MGASSRSVGTLVRLRFSADEQPRVRIPAECGRLFRNEFGHCFRNEAGHLFRSKSATDSGMNPATRRG